MAGAHQCSILGPLLFIMFINDIVKKHSNIHLFADDSSLYIVVDFLDSVAHILSLDLVRLYEWVSKVYPHTKQNHYFSLVD